MTAWKRKRLLYDVGKLWSVLVSLLCLVAILEFAVTKGKFDDEDSKTLVEYPEIRVESRDDAEQVSANLVSVSSEKLLLSEDEALTTNQKRVLLLERTCAKYSDPFRPESAVLNEPPRSLGAEVVYLTNPAAERAGSVCVPHKVGSNSWGKFVSKLNDTSSFKERFDSLTWPDKADIAIRAIVVRHPMERLVSVYRMIFEDWCNPDRFLAKQWNNVCKFDVKRDTGGTKSSFDMRKDFSVTNFLTSMLDEHQHGNDRFMQNIWEQFHQGTQLTDPKSQLKFNFAEFVRFLVNGSQEFPLGVYHHRGLNYHWAPFWKECPLCDINTRPVFILHLETFSQDLEEYLDSLGLGEYQHLFPHTHNQQSDPKLTRRLFSLLKRSDVLDLYYKYKLDHEMFGYDIQPYLDAAQPG